MEFVDIILLIIIILILIVILYNFFAYGRDLAVYPKRKIKRVSDKEYYPGSPLYDEYTDDEYSEGNSDDDGYYDTNNGDTEKKRYGNNKNIE
jgi:hypothetical protein